MEEVCNGEYFWLFSILAIYLDLIIDENQLKRSIQTPLYITIEPFFQKIFLLPFVDIKDYSAKQ